MVKTNSSFRFLEEIEDTKTISNLIEMLKEFQYHMYLPLKFPNSKYSDQNSFKNCIIIPQSATAGFLTRILIEIIEVSINSPVI